LDVGYTRIHEHKHFAPWEQHDNTVYFTEYSKETEPDDLPYYPKRLSADVDLLQKYIQLAESEKAASFMGRLGTYRYLNMDQVIGESLDFAGRFLKCVHDGSRPPIFSAT
ncbi:MAG TPA: UDP-galactopyranose mutase, partial [Chthoniobacterales bacterium]|nr:UDP-galactopyranose mutase [Chthoniobacterales bacterium]